MILYIVGIGPTIGECNIFEEKGYQHLSNYNQLHEIKIQAFSFKWHVLIKKTLISVGDFEKGDKTYDFVYS